MIVGWNFLLAWWLLFAFLLLLHLFFQSFILLLHLPQPTFDFLLLFSSHRYLFEQPMILNYNFEASLIQIYRHQFIHIKAKLNKQANNSETKQSQHNSSINN